MPTVEYVPNIVEANGKTVRQNNMVKMHAIAIGTLVEINCDYISTHKARLFVASHTRDCDGTPLYSLTHDRDYIDGRIEFEWEGGPSRSPEYIDIYKRQYRHDGFSDDCLIVIEPKESSDS